MTRSTFMQSLKAGQPVEMLLNGSATRVKQDVITGLNVSSNTSAAVMTIKPYLENTYMVSINHDNEFARGVGTIGEEGVIYIARGLRENLKENVTDQRLREITLGINMNSCDVSLDYVDDDFTQVSKAYLMPGYRQEGRGVK